MKPDVHLILGSGGARGVAHIAVIEGLENDGYKIIEVIGCSMGAVIGGIYAAGHLKEYKEWMLNLTRREVFDLLDFTFTKQGFVKGEKIFEKHKQMTGNLNIEDFPIPFTAVATDMKNHEEVYYTSGDLYKALRASVAIPGFIVPVVQDGKVLVDGGVSNPLPINLVNKKEGAITVAVDLNAKASNKVMIAKKRKHKTEVQKWFENLLPENILENHLKEEEKNDDVYSLIGLMESSFSLTQDKLTSLMLQLHQPDVLINIPRNTANTFDFEKAKDIYKIGKEAYLDSIKTI
ncbi:MAG: patatin-like phospholipase family protein [Balneolaceae bacterium]